mmetsp:Transcript_33620/g.66943  ORF Transcript_33620/g.66943 Transcript_33620/m.66943 type:complete len:131 (-) Transcript_33620:140-532(-)
MARSSNAQDNAKQYSDPVMIREVEQDGLALKGNLRVGSVAAVLALGSDAESSLAQVACPFFCAVAEREKVLGPGSRAAAERLMQVAATPEARRTIKRYNALHGILCEPEPLRSEILGDIVAWIRAEADLA